MTNHDPTSGGTATATDTDPPRHYGDDATVLPSWAKWLLLSGFAFLAVFWTWALFFASKEGVNRIEDRAWVELAEQICTAANAERVQLADMRDVSDAGPDAIGQRADIIEESTQILERMVAELRAMPVDGDKGAAILPMWFDDYDIYIADRYTYIAELRASDVNLPFYESATEDALPISEKLETFARDNEMPACGPIRDLSN